MTGKFLLLLWACACADLVTSHSHRPSSQPIRSEISQPSTDATPSVSAKETQGVTLKPDESEGDEDGFGPETVLSVHYDRGLIKELYLSQTRGGLTGDNVWKPSVSQRKRICQDLCEAGLGGDPCGYSCQAATPDMAQTLNQTQSNLKLRAASSTSSAVKPYSQTGNNQNTKPIARIAARDSAVRRNDPSPSAKDSTARENRPHLSPLASVGRLVREAIRRNRESEEKPEEDTTIESAEDTEAAGVPRSEVCPTLCLNGLGNPLCSCDTTVQRPRWSSVCDVFCSADSSYQLAGCPVCQYSSSVVVGNPQKLSDPSDFWLAWCKVQCHNGQGGAACNCDLAPMSIQMPKKNIT